MVIQVEINDEVKFKFYLDLLSARFRSFRSIALTFKIIGPFPLAYILLYSNATRSGGHNGV